MPSLGSRGARHVLRPVDPVPAFLEADAESGLGLDGVVLEVIVLLVEDEVATQANPPPENLA